MRILLDTHALLWFLLTDARLPGSARSYIVDPANTILLSPASPWEIAIKASLGNYQLPGPFFTYLTQQIDGGTFVLLPIGIAHIAVIATLPVHHKDPFDRILIAQAMVEQVPILSIDVALDAYPVTRIW